MMSAFLATTITAQEADELYYSDKMIKNGTFTWNVTASIDYYEDIPEGANFTVKLKDDLYPGPLSEEELQKVSKIWQNKLSETVNNLPENWLDKIFFDEKPQHEENLEEEVKFD